MNSPRTVVIVGGGPTGLYLSNLLSQFQIRNVVLEQQSVAKRFRHPQAHFLNTRSMELLSSLFPKPQNVRASMPPMEHWRDFVFGYNMSQQPLVTVRHPVERPLQGHADSNGQVLLPQDSRNDFPTNRENDLSPETVGHLAQHTFGKLLYQQAKQSDCATILYDTKVTALLRPPHSKRKAGVVVQTSDQQVFEADVCVGADGASSFVRQACGIGQCGQPVIQNLINIHVILPPRRVALFPKAMLYSVYNEHVVAMVVCHTIGEYIIQIPYFPPYQTMEDFQGDKLDTILESIFGFAIANDQVQSVKPWTMGSLVADRYVDQNVVLVGDAAHAFPPAGGFGMNTGLQDAHNLAWKLAATRNLAAALQSYQEERRPVAFRNAALSVRNYNRLLQVTKSMYLNEKHPSLLKTVLDHSPLPLFAKQTTFQTLLQTALRPLSLLRDPNSLYSKHLQTNLKHVLQSGMGLPLLFPKFELGVRYSGGDDEEHPLDENSDNWKSDTWGEPLPILVGGLVPHCQVRIVHGETFFPHLCLRGPKTISTVDLPAQMSRHSNPCFVLLVCNSELDRNLLDTLSSLLGLSVEAALLNAPVTWKQSDGPQILTLSCCTPSPFDEFQEKPVAILIRPDGHIAGISQDLKQPVSQIGKDLCSGVGFLRS